MSNSASKVEVQKDEWLSSALSRPCHSLTFGSGEHELSDEQLSSLMQPGAFLYTKLSPDSIDAVRYIERNGFYLVDTNVAFTRERRSPELKECGSHCRFAAPDDCAEVREVARSSFTYSRFHLDPNFPPALANEVKALWAANYFNGQRGEEMVVALRENKIAGFLQLLYRDNGDTVIDLIAVHPDCQGQGIGKQMIHFAEAQCPPSERIKVGTQLANIPSLTFYERLGFQIESAKYVFHYHQTASDRSRE